MEIKKLSRNEHRFGISNHPPILSLLYHIKDDFSIIIMLNFENLFLVMALNFLCFRQRNNDIFDEYICHDKNNPQ